MLHASWGSAGELSLVLRTEESCHADQLTYCLGPDQGFELANLNIYPIYYLLEQVKGLLLQIQVCRISMTQDNNGIS